MSNPTMYIERPGTDGLEVELDGTFTEGERGGCYSPVIPDTFEDVRAVVIELIPLEGVPMPYKVGEVIALTPKEEREAIEALLAGKKHADAQHELP